MPICQPVQATLHASDFLDGAYCFTVESVLTPQERVGMLTVSTSAGYWLTTSLTKEPKREQTFEHRQQQDGSWIANGNVTLMLVGDSLINGVVIIRNSLAETVKLTIDITSTSVAVAHLPTLTVSQSSVSFSKTSPGKPSFQLLTIAQKYAEVPVTLTTDVPEYFQMASDSRPIFSPILTLIPSSGGIYVHIRYCATKAGFHTGQLTIESMYEKTIVSLEGRSSGLLPAIHLPLPARQTMLRRSDRSPVTKRRVGILALVITVGITYAGYITGYINRCQFFPDLCQEAATEQAQTQANVSLPALATTHDRSEKIMIKTAATQREVRVSTPMTPRNGLAVRTIGMSSAEPSAKQTLFTPSRKNRNEDEEARVMVVRKKPNKQNEENLLKQPTSRRMSSIASNEESELERELNRKP